VISTLDQLVHDIQTLEATGPVLVLIGQAMSLHIPQ